MTQDMEIFSDLYWRKILTTFARHLTASLKQEKNVISIYLKYDEKVAKYGRNRSMAAIKLVHALNLIFIFFKF